MAATQSNRLVNGRLEYIDSLRGLAVLLMVMVHAAATWSPSTASQQSIIGYVAAGLGGLAAPLFVVLFCLLYTSPSPRDATLSRMPSSA